MKNQLLLFFSILALCAGCNKSAPKTEGGVRARETPLPEHFRPSRKPVLPYFERSTVGAYSRIGSKSFLWDAHAETALRLWACLLCDDGSVPYGREFHVLRGALSEALKAGCDDPLVLYAAIRSDTISTDRLVRELPATTYERIIPALAQHPYPALRQASILKRGAEAIWEIHPSQRTSELTHQAREWLDSAADKLSEVDLAEGDRAEVYAFARDLMETYHSSVGDRKEGYDRIAAALERSTSRKGVMPLVVKGAFHVVWAWDARGNGAASAVKDAGWRLFKERIGVARQTLQEAWAQDPTDSYICTAMITVAGAESSRSELETWFERGKKLNPKDGELYAAKLGFIRPQWLGSEEEMRTLARGCVAEGDWGERIPLLMINAHDMIARSASVDPSDHFRRPDVWGELEPVYKEYLSRFPGNVGVKTDYAYHAGLAGRWELANGLLDELGTNAVPIAFGSMGKFWGFSEEIRRHRQSR